MQTSYKVCSKRVHMCEFEGVQVTHVVHEGYAWAKWSDIETNLIMTNESSAYRSGWVIEESPANVTPAPARPRPLRTDDFPNEMDA